MVRKKNRRKPIWVYLFVVVITMVVSLILASTQQLWKIEYSIRDHFFEVRGPLSVENSPIVLVAISEDADSEIPEKWPWPTSVHAKLVENLNRAGAKAIIFDVLFTQQDTYNPQNDTLFAETLARYGNVVLAADIDENKTGFGSGLTPVFPLSILREKNPNPIGLVSMTNTVDGSIRTYSIGDTKLGNYFMLGLEGLRVYNSIPEEEISPMVESSPDEPFKFGDYHIKRVGVNDFIINYYGPEGLFPTYSYDTIIDDPEYTTVMEAEAFEMNSFDDPDTQTGLLYDGVFKDKIVIIGSTMKVLQDFHFTPFTDSDFPRPGFEIHAHAMQTILDGNYIRRQKNSLTLSIMAILSFLIVFFNRQVGAGWGFLLTLSIMVGHYFLARGLFLEYSHFVHVSSVFLVVIVGQVTTVGYEYINEQREKRRIKGMFASYVSPTLVEQMIESGEEPKLGGEDTYMTAFFSDIASFSSFSEKLEPQQLVALINEYLTAMTDIINDQGGTLDKFIGDAIVAFFGAPVHFDDHAHRACTTSLLMDKKLSELRTKWAQEDWPDIVLNMQHRMGMNTGEMVTGNMGSERRFNYTMMGDNVNLAARCESGAKSYHVFTMITEVTRKESEQVKDDILFRHLDTIVVKGRTKPVRMHEIVAFKKDASQQTLDCVRIYEEGMDAYYAQKWDEALELFLQCMELEIHSENPSQLFIERCNAMKKNPPSADWNGVYVMTSK